MSISGAEIAMNKWCFDIPLWSMNQAIKYIAGSRLSNRLAILIYHRVRNDADPLTPYDMKAEQFDWEMRLLHQYFNVLPLGEAVSALESHTLPDRAICITFDDGYADQVEVALPILKKYDHSAAFFIPTGYLNGGCMWNDMVTETIRFYRGRELDLTKLNLGLHKISTVTEKRETIARLLGIIKHFHPDSRKRILDYMKTLIGFDVAKNLMMSAGSIQLLSNAGMEIGCHTKMHPILTSLSDEEADTEIRASKQMLEEIIGKPVRYFAYPNGKPYEDYMPEHVEMVKQAGFEAALSTAKGVSTTESDIFQLPRFTPWDNNHAKFMLRLMSNYTETEPLVV